MWRLYLKSLEIQGFKSFPDKTVLTFGEDITAIVGPNGSGKSNISDAIRWVMGEQSTRALRGGKMEDVIFGGTAKRRQTGYAEVSLVLDNTTHIFDMEESEVMVTRRYYRSGESEYYINRRSVRLKDVNELFMDTGLGREGYSIIGQGKIDEILSVKSSDRREVFEEAAGISRYRHRKEEAERKLERTDENLVRVNDKISELELQVEPLRQQSEKAKKYLVLRDELRGLEISVWLDTLERIRAGNIKLEADYQEAVRQKNEVKTAQEKAYVAAERYSEQMREKDVEADQLRFAMQGKQARINELESAIAVLKSNIQHNLESSQRIQADLEQQQGREGSLSAQIDQRRSRLEEIEKQLAAGRQALEEKSRQAEEAAHSAGTLAQELEQLRGRAYMESADAAEAKALLSALAAAAQEVLDRDETVRRESAELEERLEQARQEAKEARKDYNTSVEERDGAKNVISGYTLRAQSRQKKLEQLKDRQVKLQMEENALASRIKLLTEMEKVHEGYSKAVKLVMGEAQRGTLKNIHGPVADLLKVPNSYTVAIETALGGAMQNLVVDREEDGKAVIQFLKRRDAGRATILPISSIRPGQLREAKELEGQPGFVGIGDQLISFQPQYQTVFSNLLGRVVVMEDLDTAIAAARKYGYKFRIVTLDGQVLNPGGSMTGGSASRSAGILSRANELERLGEQSTRLKEQLMEAGRQVSEAERESTAAAYELETAQSQLREWENAVLKAEAQVEHCRSVVASLEKQQESQHSELEQLQARSAQIEQDTQTARTRIEVLEGAAAALKSEAEGKAKGQADLQERSARIAQQAAELTAAQSALEAEREATRSGLEELVSLKESIAGDRDQSRALMADYQAKNEDFTRQIAGKEEDLAALREECRKDTDAVARLNQEKLELEGERVKATRESQSRNEELLRIEGEVSRLEQRKVSASMEEKQLLDKLWETYELSHEAARQQRVEIESVPKASRRIAELKRGISALGNVNVGAIEEFQRVNERYTYLTEQRDDVAKAKQELEDIIASITQEMKTIFQREFQTINEAFGQTFLELFGGGKATLELEDPDDILGCGIEIKVQPPGKALKVITLLSGGEKAFVAIALYFAIMKVRPTPFVVMDEIEAALDDNNVVRFAQYMRSMADKTQFIVITHRRGTMEEADVLYGVTMQEQGVSRMLTINLNDVEKELNIR
ncbi:chromosome segregation protein SMC [Flavonifractor sp. An100]|uniref:chromosome segregation protein SMC n=1 Tax=Flavonifractor sp. An100 TaxID=1965538 RepID=UPI000B3869F0|nr:chromosome segregation protein SMC [Flavonifractor sp. An100]